MKKRLVLLLLPLSFYSLANTELKGSPEELRTFLHPKDNLISISQSAEKITYKDVALVSLQVTTEHKKLAASLKENARLRASISSFLQTQGIDEDSIKNAKFSTSPDYGWFGDKPDSFKVSNTLTIRISDELGLQHIAQVVDKYQEVSLISTTYEHSLKKQYLQKVKEEALDKVLAQKAFYMKKLGVTLQAVSFRDANAYAQNEEVVQVRGKRSVLSSSSKEAYSAPKNMSFEKLTYKANVTVSFKVISAP